MNFDISKFKNIPHNNTRYDKRIRLLQDKWIDTKAIEETVINSINNIVEKSNKSFVIYWEPQS